MKTLIAVILLILGAAVVGSAQIAVLDQMPPKYQFDFRADKIYVLTPNSAVLKLDTLFQYVEVYYNDSDRSFTIEANNGVMSKTEIKAFLDDKGQDAERVRDRYQEQFEGLESIRDTLGRDTLGNRGG